MNILGVYGRNIIKNWGFPMKLLHILIHFGIILCVLQGCSQEMTRESANVIEKKMVTEPKPVPEPEHIEEPFDLSPFHRKPLEWGENVNGVKNRMRTNEKKIALTFDACGGPYGSNYDEKLITFLMNEKVPATLFVNERWINENKTLFLELAANPLFQIENHGTAHSPLSVAGGEAWGIPATGSPEEAYEEIMKNHETVKALTGKEMKLFRSGTAYYDEVAVELANSLGYEVVNFDILGDAGATFTSEQVKNALLSAKEGSIALLHMNQPNSGTAEGVIQAIPLLREKGFEFVLLDGDMLE